MTRNVMRNKPVNAITSFFPTDEVKNSDHFIRRLWDGDLIFANLLPDDERMTKKFRGNNHGGKRIFNRSRQHETALFAAHRLLN
jgi:hypothetical protein